MTRFLFYAAVLCLLITGCSKVPPADDYTVSCTVANRIDAQVAWRQGICEDVESSQFIQCIIASELSADAAIQVALLNNPKIQATFEELGISRGHLIEAGLLSNPSFEIEVRYPHTKGLHTNIEYLITSSLLDIFLIPLRTRLATTEFEQTKLRVSNEILNLAFDVRETYYELLTEEQKIVYLQDIVDITGIITDLFVKQAAVGNINALEFELAQSRFFDVQLELQQSQTNIIRLREKLNRLLGFQNDPCLIIPKDIPNEINDTPYDLCALESIALQERLDLQIARFELTRMSQLLGLKDWWTYSNLRAGLAGEREPGGANLIGPGFSGDLPIFNYGQGARASLYAQWRQAQDHLAELEIRVLSQVREAYKLLMSYRKIIDNYKNQLLPMQSQILLSSDRLYNVMGLGVDKLLENKRQEMIANKNYLESINRFLMARVELDRALGGYLYKLLAQPDCASGDEL